MGATVIGLAVAGPWSKLPSMAFSQHPRHHIRDLAAFSIAKDWQDISSVVVKGPMAGYGINLASKCIFPPVGHVHHPLMYRDKFGEFIKETIGVADPPFFFRNPDSYHTCYILAGLSTAQHHHFHTGIASAGEPNNPFPSAFSWSHAPATASTEQGQSSIVFNEEDRLEVVHPLFVIPHRAAGKLREWCQKHPLQIWTSKKKSAFANKA